MIIATRKKDRAKATCANKRNQRIFIAAVDHLILFFSVLALSLLLLPNKMIFTRTWPMKDESTEYNIENSMYIRAQCLCMGAPQKLLKNKTNEFAFFGDRCWPMCWADDETQLLHISKYVYRDEFFVCCCNFVQFIQIHTGLRHAASPNSK